MNENFLKKSLVDLIRRLKAKKYRDTHGLFLSEGEKSVVAVLSGGASLCKVHSLVCTREFCIKNKDFLANLSDSQIHFATAEQLAAMGSLKSNNAAIAVCYKFADAQIPANESSLALCAIRDPGNLGTIVRTAHWFGIKNIICSPDCVDLYNPKVIQASMGSFLHVRVVYADLADFFSRTKMPILGAYPKGRSLYEAKMPEPAIVLVGGESHGIAPELERYISDKISVPRVSENVDSLNAAMATAIICSWWRVGPFHASVFSASETSSSPLT